MFICPICGNNSYSTVLDEIFKCDKCSALFSDPFKFGIDHSKKNIRKGSGKVFVPGEILKHVYTKDVAGVVSKPIKLKRN